MKVNLEWCANWTQDEKYYCTLFIREAPAAFSGFYKFLENNFGKDYGAWRYDKHRHGVELWFRRQEDMLTFKMMIQTTEMI